MQVSAEECNKQVQPCQTKQDSIRLSCLKVVITKSCVISVCKTALFELCRISTIRQYLTADATKTLVVSLVPARIDYCNSLLAGLPLSLIYRLQRIQNCAVRLVVHAPPNVHTTPILAQLLWLPVQAGISYEFACLCFSSINSSTPAYL